MQKKGMNPRHLSILAPAMAVGALLLAPNSASAIVDSYGIFDINSIVGADTFYAAGYTGSGAIVANIESGYAWNGQESLSNVSTYISDPSVTGQFDRHATWVGSAIAGNANSPQPEWARGIAYGSTLWSGAIATDWINDGSGNFTGSFDLSDASFYTPYYKAMIAGVAGQTADVINSSYGESGAGGNLNGNDPLAIVTDSLTGQSGKLLTLSAGNSGPGNTVFAPASGNNGLVVGATTGDLTFPQYGTVSTFSSTSPSDFFKPTSADGSTGTVIPNVRARVNMVAPGTDLLLAYYGGNTGGNSFSAAAPDLSTQEYEYGLAGTSFAAPIVAGGAALIVSAGKTLYASDAHAIDGRVLKSVLMNSATKLDGWTNTPTMIAGVNTTTQGIDYSQGAGELNLTAAFAQYTAGTHDVPTPAPGTSALVQTSGWTYGTIAHNAGHEVAEDYLLNQTLPQGENLAITLNWYDTATSGLDANQNLIYSYGAFDNLDLQVWQTTGGVATNLIAQSDSLYNSTESLYFPLPTDGTFLIRVLEDNYVYNFDGSTSTPFGLAWNVSFVPEPGTVGIMIVASGFALRRRTRSKR